MSTSSRLSLPYIAPQQAQKQITYNAAITLLDQLVQPVLLSRTVATPPASPAEGDGYAVAPGATGAWAGKDNLLARWQGGAWTFTVPATGWMAYVRDTTDIAIFGGTTWAKLAIDGTALASFGINATADLTNRLAVAADGSLFTHAGSSHRLKLNKANLSDTASLLLQTGYSGRCEIGLTGDDAFHLKVSDNGSSWTEALTVAPATGLVSLPVGQLAFPATANPSANANTLDDYREGTWTPTMLFSGASVGVTYGAATGGRYTRIGRTVFAHAILTLTSKGTSVGAAQIGGLPFTSVADSIPSSAAVGNATAFSSVSGAVLGAVGSGSSRISLHQSASGAATPLTSTNLGNSSAIYVSVTYDS